MQTDVLLSIFCSCTDMKKIVKQYSELDRMLMIDLILRNELHPMPMTCVEAPRILFWMLHIKRGMNSPLHK